MSPFLRSTSRVFLTLLVVACVTAPLSAANLVEQVEPPHLDFYPKRLVVEGITIRAHADVDDEALVRASWIISRMIEDLRPRVVERLQANRVEMHVLGKNQVVTDLPQYRDQKGKFLPDDDNPRRPSWMAENETYTMDSRARGYGGRECVCPEENLLGLPQDTYGEIDVCLHEFAHVIHQYGLAAAEKQELEELYEWSLGQGRWFDTYAGSNHLEYFADASLWYLGSTGGTQGFTVPVETGPLWLRDYDPEIYEFLDRVYTSSRQPSLDISGEGLWDEDLRVMNEALARQKAAPAVAAAKRLLGWARARRKPSAAGPQDPLAIDLELLALGGLRRAFGLAGDLSRMRIVASRELKVRAVWRPEDKKQLSAAAVRLEAVFLEAGKPNRAAQVRSKLKAFLEWQRQHRPIVLNLSD